MRSAVPPIRPPATERPSGGAGTDSGARESFRGFPPGFTLVELLVALVITGFVALLAGRVFSGLSTAAIQVRSARELLDHEMNAHRWLTDAFLNLEVGTPGSHPFEGHAESVTFTSWHLTSEGWLERGTVQLAVSGKQLQAEYDANPPVTLADSIGRVDFDYLLEPGADTRWVREWLSPVSAPLALRLRITHLAPGETVDTILLLIKERG